MGDTKNKMPASGIPTSRIIAATAFMLFGVFGSLKLKTSVVIGEPSLIFIFCITTLASLFIAFYDRIGSLSLRDLKLEMAKVESTRKEVEQREQDVRRIAFALAEITTFLAAFHRRIGSDESHATEVRWLTQKVSSLLDGMAASESERQSVFRYLAAVTKMDATKETDRAAAEAQWSELWRAIDDEIHKATKPAA